MKNLDVIGIGAVNFDYMFYCKKREFQNRSVPEGGLENLSYSSRNSLEDEIDTLVHTVEYGIQFCGSAYFALKTINAINPNLKLSYVGVVGKPTNREIRAGFNNDVKDEFSFLSNNDWLFFDDNDPGIAVVKLYKGMRAEIDIDAGANNNLESHIKNKEAKDGVSSFSNFLSTTKWIHISSLADFNQFKYLIEQIRIAKSLNPWLKVSFDPGYEYTKRYRLDLKNAFNISDYIFLNQNEVDNLVGDGSLSRHNKFDGLSAIFLPPNSTNIIIIKGKQNHEVINYLNGEPYTRTYWHRTLKPIQIHNDTGAGDAFAGGLIAGILSNDLLVQQETAIKLGAIAAASRMSAKDEPFNVIRDATQLFFRKHQKKERLNFREKLRIIIDEKKSVLIAILTGIIGTALWEVIKLFFV